MDSGLLGPWVILGGFVLAGGLLIVAGKLEGRVSLAGRGRTWTAVLFGAGVAVASETTAIWFQWSIGSDIPELIFYVFPFAVAVLGWALKRSQRHWMSRIAEHNGRSYTNEGEQRPSFGVLPFRGLAVGHDDPRAGFTAAVEFDHHGYRVLGVQYMMDQGADPREEGSLAKASNMVDGTYNMVQVRTPQVPSMVIRPRPTREQATDFGGLEPSDIHPLQDAKLTKNTVGALNVEPPARVGSESLLQVVTLGDAEFDKRFEVCTTHPDFARAALDQRVRAALVEEPWYWVREVVFQQGSIRAAESGHLSEKDLFEDSRHVAELAGMVPVATWQQWGGYPFGADLGADSTSREVWHGVEAPSGAASVKARVNLRRRAAQRPPLSAASIIIRSVLIPVLFVLGASPIANAALAAVNLAYDVELTVTEVDYNSQTTHGGSSPLVSGRYERDGETYKVNQSMWWSFNIPEEGDVVEVEIGPIWWNQMFAGPVGIVMTAGLMLLPLLLSYALVKLTFLPKRKVRILNSRTQVHAGKQPSS